MFEKLTFFAFTGSKYTDRVRTRTREVITKGYSKSGLPLINKEDYEIFAFV